MTQIELFNELSRRNLDPDLAENGAFLCRFPGLPDYGIGIDMIGDYLSCYAYETYAGSDIGIAGHETLDAAIAWGMLLIVTCETRLSAELATMKREI
jgi:hypothetical protein